MTDPVQAPVIAPSKEEPVSANDVSLDASKAQEAAVEALPEDSKLAEQFQRLSKQEAHTREQRKQLEEARKAFEVERSLADEMKSLKDLRAKDPLAVLEKLGLSVDDLNKAINEKSQANDPISRRLKMLEDELNKERQGKVEAEERMQVERTNRAKAALDTEIAKVIKEKEFDLIPALGMDKDVFAYMEGIYETTGEVPTVEAACQAVTDRIVEMYEKASKSKWVQKKEPVKSETESKPSVNTLSNKLAQATQGADKPMTEKQRMQAAIRAMEASK